MRGGVKSLGELPVWLVYAGIIFALSWFCFGDLRHHLLDTHDAESFSDHLRIAQDASYFFSPAKEQATGRLLADAVKYLAFLTFGNEAAAFHLLVVALHALASLLLALLVRHMGCDLDLALPAGLLFLLNVTHFQAVHWISALDYPLGMVCACTALICLERGKRWNVLSFSALMVLAVQAHPSLAALWLVPLYRQWRARVGHRRLLRFMVTALPLAAAVVASVLLASHQTSTWRAVEEYGSASALILLLGQVRVLLLFSSRLLSTAHWLPLPVYSQSLWELALGLVVVGVLIYLLRTRRAPLDWSALWVLAGLFPYLLLTASTVDDLPAGPSRYLYVASAGSSLLLAAVLQWIYRRWRHWGMLALIAVLCSSYWNLRKVEAISLYTSARSYSARLDIEHALSQYERALVQAPDVLPLEDLYIRYIIILMDSERDHRPALRAARALFPASSHLRLYALADRATSADVQTRHEAIARIRKEGQVLIYAHDLSMRALHNLGSGFLKKGNPQRAVIAFEQALHLAPQGVKTLGLLGLAHVRRAAELAGSNGQVQERISAHLDSALVAYRKSLQLHPDPALFYALGCIHEESGRLDSALAAYRSCLVHDSRHVRSLRQTAQIYQLHGDDQQAIDVWHRLLEVGQDADAYFALGDLYYRGGAPALAAQAYAASSRLEPGSMESHANLGNALRQLGRLEEARSAYARAIELVSDNPYLYHNLGEVEALLGNMQGAIVAFEQALAQGTQHEATYAALAVLLRAAGRATEAEDLEEQAKRRGIF